MVLDAATWLYNRLRPQEGWLSFALLLLVVAILLVAILDVGWVAEDFVVVPAALLGLLMGVVFAKRPIPSWMAWLLIALYGILIVILTLGRLWPPPRLLFTDWPALRLYWLENGEILIDRTASWIAAIAVGGRSNETVVFAIFMGLAAWFLAAYLGWSAYHSRQPLLGLTLMGLLIAINGYYGAAKIEWAAMYVGLAVLATAVFRFAQLEGEWNDRLVDYSAQIRLELIVYAAGIGVGLLAVAFLLPSFKINRVASFFLGNENVAALEDALERAFGGVDVPRASVPAPGQPGGSGVLPRAFLVGNAPELEKIVMMTATAELLDGPQGASLFDVPHWRALSYEVYTGRGWSISGEREEDFAPFESIPFPFDGPVLRIRQNVHWRYDNRSTRYTLGYPVSADHAVTVHWRDRSDLVRVTAPLQNQYEITSVYPAATPRELRSVELQSIHPAILRRYLQLPSALPQRVLDLAQEVAGDQETPYDQALALERFLRQYEYSLDVPFPPADRDVVDYFLFDLQKGYCDYFASAMVVMARSLGLPARLATGYLVQAPNEEGVQIIHQINSHAWAEVYFEGYGWVEFEPTAAFASPHAPGAPGELAAAPPRLPDADSNPPPASELEQPGWIGTFWPWIAAIAVLVVTIGYLAWRQTAHRRAGLDDVQAAFAHLQEHAARLHLDQPPGQTPSEFNDRLQAYLSDYEGMRAEVEEIREPAGELTAIFNEHQYSRDPADKGFRARQLWRRVRSKLWRLRISNALLSRKPQNSEEEILDADEGSG